MATKALCYEPQSTFQKRLVNPRFHVEILGATIACFGIVLLIANFPTWVGARQVNDVAFWAIDAICMSATSDNSVRPAGIVQPISSYALPNVPGKRITI